MNVTTVLLKAKLPARVVWLKGYTRFAKRHIYRYGKGGKELDERETTNTVPLEPPFERGCLPPPVRWTKDNHVFRVCNLHVCLDRLTHHESEIVWISFVTESKPRRLCAIHKRNADRSVFVSAVEHGLSRFIWPLRKLNAHPRYQRTPLMVLAVYGFKRVRLCLKLGSQEANILLEAYISRLREGFDMRKNVFETK